MNVERIILENVEDGNGILRLEPTWVPRSFLSPGRRLKLSSEDLYILGATRGGIDERWFSSTTKADNGPGTPEDEGLSYIQAGKQSKSSHILLKDAIEYAGDMILGKHIMKKYGGWTIYAKFFDNSCPIPLHLHLLEEHARRVNRVYKPEGYYFPPQLNFTESEFPYTFFGLEPDTSKDDIKRCLERWDKGDNRILDYSKAYRLKPGTSWLVPAGILHAPGSLVTYEVQKASDVFSMLQSMLGDRPVPWDLVVKDVPKDLHSDFDYIVSMIDWEANVEPEFKKHNYLDHVPAINLDEMTEEGYEEKWIVHGIEDLSAKELTVFPERTVTIHDSGAYGLIAVQGYGMIGEYNIESATMIKYGQITCDEFFVTCDAAKDGIKIQNRSSNENLVMLKHFGPGNPDSPK